MKALFASALIALTTAGAAIPDRYLVLNVGRNFLAPNGAKIPLQRGDYVKFIRRDSAWIYFQVGTVGVFSVPWNEVLAAPLNDETFKHVEETARRVVTQYFLEIPPPAQGVMRRIPRPNELPAIADEPPNISEAMRRVEAEGTYAVAVRSADIPGWSLEIGEAFPFLGFRENEACLRIGASFMFVPRECVKTESAAENPTLKRTYEGIRAAYVESLRYERAEQMAAAQLRTLQRIEAQQWRAGTDPWWPNFQWEQLQNNRRYPSLR